MEKKVECECGVTLTGADDDELVAAVQQHGKEVHDMEIDREQALSMARPA